MLQIQWKQKPEDYIGGQKILQINAADRVTDDKASIVKYSACRQLFWRTASRWWWWSWLSYRSRIGSTENWHCLCREKWGCPV